MDDVSFRAWESALLLLGCQNSFSMLLQNYCITRRDLAHFSRYNMDSRNHLLTKVALTLKKRLLLQNTCFRSSVRKYFITHWFCFLKITYLQTYIWRQIMYLSNWLNISDVCRSHIQTRHFFSTLLLNE